MFHDTKVSLIAVLAVCGLVLVPAAPAGSAAAVPTISVKFDESLTNPLFLRNDASDSRAVKGRFTTSGGPVSNVRFEWGGDGLKEAQVAGGGPTTGYTLPVSVTSTSGGFHRLSLTITSDETGPQTFTGPLYYVPGGEPIPATGDLTGRAYGWTDKFEYQRGELRGTRDTLLTFLDEDTAFVGAPRKGLPRCSRVNPTATEGCLPYRYDKATGYVQLGGRIAQVVGNKLWVSGFGVPYDGGTYVNDRFVKDRVVYPGAGARYTGSWVGGEEYPPNYRYTLSLSRKGRFVLRTFRYDAKRGPVRVTQRGTYALTARGRLVLRTDAGRRSVTTLLIAANAKGEPKPGKAVWMVFRSESPSGDASYNEVKLKHR